MIRTKRITFVMAALCFAALGHAAEKKFDKKFSVALGGTLNIKTDIGSVNIVGAEGKEVEVHVTVSGRQRDLDEFEISATENANGVQVTGKHLRARRLFDWGGADLDVRFEIKVPKEYSLRMETSGGDISVSNVKGMLNGGTSGGNITLNDIVGAIELETSGGDIRVQKVEGKVLMETSGGNIKINDVTGDVDVNTSGGNVVLSTINGRVRAETSGGNITMKVKESNKGIYAETSGGNIDITLPKNISANVDASTSGGEVTCDFPITMQGRLDESRIRGTINGGGSQIYAHTSGGNITIRGLEN